VAEVVDERLRGNLGAEPGIDCPSAEIVVLEVADTELFIKKTDLVDHRSAEKKAKADEPIDRYMLPGMLMSPFMGEAVDRS
jgi:hypothetical protein